jgi:hypothetical protein
MRATRRCSVVSTSSPRSTPDVNRESRIVNRELQPSEAPASTAIHRSRFAVHDSQFTIRQSRLIRLAAAVIIGVAFAAYEDAFRASLDSKPSDFAQPVIAGQLLLEGRDPYREIGPNGPVPHQFHLIYPATAGMVAIPFGFVSLRLADALFVGIGSAVLLLALTRDTLWNPQLLVFASFPMAAAAQNVQWSPLLTAAAFFPILGFVYACKPSVALAYWIAYPNGRALMAAAGFTALTVALWPWWPAEWVVQLSTVTHMSAPVTRWGGPLLLLAALRWRRPEARLLLALSCIPQTPVIYEAVPLFLIVTTLREGVVLLVMTVLVALVMPKAGTLSYDAWMAVVGSWTIWLVYLPCLIMVLRRPNVAADGDRFGSIWTSARDYFARLMTPSKRPSESAP